MKKLDLRKIFVFIITTVFLFTISFVVKGLALRNITAELNNPLFELDYLINTGAAFSAFKGSTYILAVLGLVIIFFIVMNLCYNSYRTSYLKVLFISSFTAGIAANIFERFHDGFVTDYINLKLFSFPVFNFQDILIVVSGIVLVFLYQFEKKHVKPCLPKTELQYDSNSKNRN